VSGRALLAELAGERRAALDLYDDAAIRWRALDNPYEHARALAGRARCLDALGRPDEAALAADGAGVIFERLGVVCPERLAPAPFAAHP
jgi:hypothetical protein